MFFKEKADELQKKLVNFVHCSLNGRLHRKIDISRSCFDLIDLIRERHKEIRKYQLLILTTSSISSMIKIIESSDIDGVASECQIGT